jgi:hypothetical protein
VSTHPPVPLISRETAMRKLRMAEDGWNSPENDRFRKEHRTRKPCCSGSRLFVIFLTGSAGWIEQRRLESDLGETSMRIQGSRIHRSREIEKRCNKFITRSNHILPILR